MANKTYLQLVNDVLIRLRENEVVSVNDTTYSKLIGKFINDAKRKVEDACDWNSLRQTLTVNTVSGVYSYALTGAGIRLKVIDVIDDTNDRILNMATTTWMNEQYLTNTQNDQPLYYNFNGVDSNNDTLVDFYPKPNGAYSIKFNIIKPQAELSSDSDVLLVPAEPVIFGAYAKALAERGEDGGLLSSEASIAHLQSLADHVAVEVNRNEADIIWDAP